MDNVNDAITEFVRLRDKRSELKKRFDEIDSGLKQKQDQIETFLLAQANEQGVDSFVIKGVGTAYRRIKLRPMITDFDLFMDFVSTSKAYDAVQKRVNTSFVEDYMEANNGTPPAGIGATRQYEMVIRRS